MNIFLNDEEQRPRSGWRILFQLLLFALFTVLLLLVRSELFPSGPLFVYAVIPLFLAGVGSVWITAVMVDRRRLAAYGLRPDARWFRELGIGLAIGTAAMAAIFAVEWLGGWITVTGFGWDRISSIPYALWLISYLLAMGMVGFYEELMFRGYQILNLTEGFRGPAGRMKVRRAALLAVLLSSVVFALMHARNPNASLLGIVNIVLAGFLLAAPYLVTGRLALSVGIHISWNFVQGGLLGFAVSGHPFRGSLLQVQQQGAGWITGSQFGPEAGLMGLFGMLIMGLLLQLYFRKSGFRWRIHDLFRSPPQKSLKTDEQGS